MNERIRELAVEARLLTGWPVGEVEYQKFAELIVLEVLNVQENLMANGHNAWHLHKPTKKHFGVKE
ncbi:MAG: hypothetical protein EBR82_78905 [Caulobacteraceae bacterium]|nr:hypothetical protein [Caulobacteraceae bacterium]